MLAVTDAEATILALTSPITATEWVPLTAVVDRVLSRTVKSAVAFPYWDNTAMDGYAVRAADVQTVPVTLQIIEEIPAGTCPQQVITTGMAARIFTGAMLPCGADTIVIQENTTRAGDRVTILTAPSPQAFVRHQGSFAQVGDSLIKAGTRVRPAEVAILATVQASSVEVYRRPRVIIFSTGDELIPPDGCLQPGQIVDSNQYALAAFVAQQGAEPRLMGIIPDRPEDLKAAIAQAVQQADIVLSTGGVSVGDRDYIDPILAELGGAIHLRSVAMKPGKPLTVATFGDCLYFGIPGNPVSALVACWRFVRLALQKKSGLAHPWRLPFAVARSRHPLTASGTLETYLWGQVQDGEFHLAAGSRSSGNLINLAGANALAIVPVGTTEIPAGAAVQVMYID